MCVFAGYAYLPTQSPSSPSISFTNEKPAAAAAVGGQGSQEDKAFPTPSGDDPESSDLGLPSPHSPAFESAPSSPKPDAHAVPESESEHQPEQNVVDLGEPEEGEEEAGKKDEEEAEEGAGASKPPMELEEVVEAPERDEHEHGHEHEHQPAEEGDAQPGDEAEQHQSEHDDHHH